MLLASAGVFACWCARALKPALLESGHGKPPVREQALPALRPYPAADARPALEAVLAANRAELAALTAQAAPTFRSLVVPVEEMGYRLSRVWSPVSHLNGVANSAPSAPPTTSAYRC